MIGAVDRLGQKHYDTGYGHPQRLQPWSSQYPRTVGTSITNPKNRAAEKVVLHTIPKPPLTVLEELEQTPSRHLLVGIKYVLFP